MQLEGIHHVTAITGNAPQNVDFYVRVLGLRLVKRTVNQDDPTVYHLFYADEQGSAGSDITFFEYPGARRGRAGAGMVHTVAFRVASEEALDFWEQRLADEGAKASRSLLEHTLGFTPIGEAAWDVRGEGRGGLFGYDAPPADRGVGGAGTVHHVAFATQTHEQDAWQQEVALAGFHPTPVIDRFWFRSIYFREPSGVLFELATLGPGFSVDEDPAHLGEKLILPPAFEHLRERIEPVLTPIENPRTAWVR